MAALTIACTTLAEQTYAAEADGAKVVVHEGSSGSSKTISLAQVLLARSFEERGKLYTVTRATLPALKKGALRDWNRVLQWAKIGGKEAATFFDENKTDRIFTNSQTGTQIEFTVFDDEVKARGPRRDRLWCNEANELALPIYRQLAKRTRGTIYLDYNPSMQRHWIYKEILPREDCEHIHSTYKVNRFLTSGEVREVEAAVPVYRLADGSRLTDWKLGGAPVGAVLESGDPVEWSVFGLGLRCAAGEAIYPALYESRGFHDFEVYGLDFGFSHPLSLVRIGLRDVAPKPELHVDQVIHSSGLDPDDLLALLVEHAVPKRAPIYCDGARPELVEQLRRAGYNAHAADKSKGSVYAGILHLKKHRLCFTARSRQARDQCADYRWKKHTDGTVMDEPVKLSDDAPDAIRYAAYTHYGKPRGGFYAGF